MTPERRRFFLAMAGCLLVIALAFAAFSRPTGFDFSWLTGRLFRAPSPARVVAPIVAIKAFSGDFDAAGRYRFSGRLSAMTDKPVLDPIVSVEIRDADSGRYLDHARIVLPTIEPGAEGLFDDSLPVPAGVARLTATVEVVNQPFSPAAGLVRTSSRAQ